MDHPPFLHKNLDPPSIVFRKFQPLLELEKYPQLEKFCTFCKIQQTSNVIPLWFIFMRRLYWLPSYKLSDDYEEGLKI